MTKVAVFLLSLFFLTGSLFSAEQIKEDLKSLEKRAAVKSVINDKITYARRLISDRQYEAAMVYLETLYEQEPNNTVVINLLRQSYDRLQLYPKTELLIQRELEKFPTNFSLMVSLADIYAKQGRFDEAAAAYNNAKDVIDGRNTVKFQVLTQSMLGNNLYDETESNIKYWRTEFADSTILALEMGMILESQKKYKEAVAEYYPLFTDTTRTGNNAEKKVVSLLKFIDSEKIVENWLLDQPDVYHNPRTVEILSNHYLSSSQMDRAFEFTLIADSIEQKNGTEMIQFMTACNKRKMYEYSLKMEEMLGTKVSDPEVLNRARFLTCEALVMTGQYRRALTEYDSLYATTQSNRYKADALYQTGLIWQDHLNSPDTALLYFDSVSTLPQSGFTSLFAQTVIPLCHLQKGDIPTAKSLYEQLKSKRGMTEDLKEEVDYQLAMINLFEKKVDTARNLLSKLMIDYPKGFYVNDALELMKVIDEGSEAPQVLYNYSNYLLFDYQHQGDSAFAKLELIANDQSKVLADFALYKMVLRTFDNNDTTGTVIYIDRLNEDFPESYYLPYALKQKADILFGNKSDRDEAVIIYQELLEKYPNYPFVSEIRELLRNQAENAKA
ncbi:MAG: hypothetical protein DWP97_09685 [Calditrichaeota bacterium]|nr:MAG: hypothetical protein DWP97_09685 [Calditrichota bacterium]